MIALLQIPVLVALCAGLFAAPALAQAQTPSSSATFTLGTFERAGRVVIGAVVVGPIHSSSQE